MVVLIWIIIMGLFVLGIIFWIMAGIIFSNNDKGASFVFVLFGILSLILLSFALYDRGTGTPCDISSAHLNTKCLYQIGGVVEHDKNLIFVLYDAEKNMTIVETKPKEGQRATDFPSGYWISVKREPSGEKYLRLVDDRQLQPQTKSAQ